MLYADMSISASMKGQVTIPAKTGIYSFYYLDKRHNKQYICNRIQFIKDTCFSLRMFGLKIKKDSYSIAFKQHEFHVQKIRRQNWIGKLKGSLHDIAVLLKRKKKLCFYRLFNKRQKKYILINGRPNIARDNGEAMFIYINENKKCKDVAKHTYFVIDKGTEDYKRLKRIGKVVAYGSAKHKYLFLNSKTILSSHLHPALSI